MKSKASTVSFESKIESMEFVVHSNHSFLFDKLLAKDDTDMQSYKTYNLNGICEESVEKFMQVMAMIDPNISIDDFSDLEELHNKK